MYCKLNNYDNKFMQSIFCLVYDSAYPINLENYNKSF